MSRGLRAAHTLTAAAPPSEAGGELESIRRFPTQLHALQTFMTADVSGESPFPLSLAGAPAYHDFWQGRNSIQPVKAAWDGEEQVVW
ncbi:MAG: hypothetical protein KF777_11490 [Planctomycetaceae bacterium]|nr:hypothetical protein [Planctomycetaceae bacterium]